MRAGAHAMACGAWLAVFGTPASAQLAEDLARQQATQSGEYERIRQQISLSEERIAEIRDEIDGIRKDEQTLSAALVQAAKTERKLGEDMLRLEDRIEALSAQRTDLVLSLRARRGVLAEVLGALQRMGLNPPPAILVRPEDALASVRSAILLGAVVPEMRIETEILAGDLAELDRLTASIDAEREMLRETASEQVAEKQRLVLLLDEKSKLRGRSQDVLEAETRRAAELAERAESMRELIDTLQAQLDSARAAEERAAADVPDANRLSPALAFETLKGRLPLPVAGTLGHRFGSHDDTGMALTGDIVRTQSGAIVTAPADGTVLYAGPFRSYGQLLILDAGSDYHVVLSGMARISVVLGQSVLAGEPIGTMGEARLASAVAIGSENSVPELYVELRKGRVPLDPAPWWADNGRTGNDS